MSQWSKCCILSYLPCMTALPWRDQNGCDIPLHYFVNSLSLNFPTPTMDCFVGICPVWIVDRVHCSVDWANVPIQHLITPTPSKIKKSWFYLWSFFKLKYGVSLGFSDEVISSVLVFCALVILIAPLFKRW